MNPTDTNTLIQETIASIRPIDGAAMKKASERMDGLLKPPGSLGRLEEIGIRLAGIQGNHQPKAKEKLSLVFAASHGVAEEGVSMTPSSVDGIMVRAIAAGKAGINVLARRAGAEVRVIDVGVSEPYEEPENVVVQRVRRGTANFLKETAMTEHEAAQALVVGITTAKNAIQETGAKIVGIGEMGIGNTTAAAALTSVFTDSDPALVTGAGTGLPEDALRRKIRVVRDSLALHQPNPENPLGVLSAVGGLEIAAMAGAMLAAASEGALVVVDGFISGSAALCAAAFAPMIRERMVLSHLSVEPGHKAMAAALELRPLVNLGFRLGEGTGSAAVMPLIEDAAALLTEMGTLEEELVAFAPPEHPSKQETQTK
ncbi:MAG: nicotinate-nucleotide--dimethylbenzimidazole phosphoribosyltransferase [Spirochaetales bacterium]|nr:nicotinate-nucleotide--dimethylbenzimidazole phosphoribosyltransferase [Spirochaetales bacterium]